MRTYSMDLRERVLAAFDAGLSAKAVAVRFAVSVSFVGKLRRHRRATGSAAPAPRRHGPRPTWQAHADALRAAVAAAPDLTLREYRDRHAFPFSVPTLARALAALGLTRKKSRAGRPSRAART